MNLDNRIKFRHLACFLEVARQRSFAKAADAVAVSQPAISKTLKELEEILGARLATIHNLHFYQQLMARIRAAIGESSTAGSLEASAEPRRVGQPATTRLSLMVTGTPSSGPSGSPFARRASAAFAIARGTASSRTTKALMVGSKRSIRPSASFATSTGESAFFR